MARHAASPSQRRPLLRAGLTLTAAGAVLGLAGASAQAAQSAAPASLSDIDTPLPGAGTAAAQGLASAAKYGLSGVVSPVANLKLDPLAGTGVDPLDNVVGTQIADFQPLNTGPLTDPITNGASLSDLPVIGQATRLLTG
ncbi:hypothetical protein QR77_25980 [Streptomyces sp. 150FB]|uniref:hypothetical protein n=1 Tax=Streptomyces sp. 150FB TaxID=1576605 RepID=UPI00058967F3|nr:hypothetical protein [Streptomyces sp. 150FB]KIF76396.1 hypothetical protein QR77_25980 [Streptomyces sp. 150FB]